MGFCYLFPQKGRKGGKKKKTRVIFFFWRKTKKKVLNTKWIHLFSLQTFPHVRPQPLWPWKSNGHPLGWALERRPARNGDCPLASWGAGKNRPAEKNRLSPDLTWAGNFLKIWGAQRGPRGADPGPPAEQPLTRGAAFPNTFPEVAKWPPVEAGMADLFPPLGPWTLERTVPQSAALLEWFFALDMRRRRFNGLGNCWALRVFEVQNPATVGPVSPDFWWGPKAPPFFFLFIY